MKRLIIIKVLFWIGVITFMASCSSTPHNICKQNEIQRINGNVMYIYGSRMYDCRTIVLGDRDTKRSKWIVIHNVPLDQPLKDIPVCKKGKRYYWVMP